VAKAALKKASSGAKSARSLQTRAKAKPTVKVQAKAIKKAPAKASVRPMVSARTSAVKPAAPARKSNPPTPATNPRARERAASAPDAARRPEPINGGSIAPPVPSNDKPRKNQAGFSTRELEHFRDLLLAKRREIVGDMSAMEREALRTSGGSNLSTLPIHMADMGTDNYEQEFTLGLVETERKLLREINNALAKIQNGSYVLCEGTGKPISPARLEVQPWARYGIEFAKKMERGGR
jgi:DnaK suppressor protein